ncbi:MAG TPA: Flp pilus assembly protein CpaB [Gemmatimonadaceae bacterium]|nr:Flp pilus assembly protein CpaB [Gemmatimonadaceae bacterium]
MAERRYSVVFYAALVVAAGATYGVYKLLQHNRESARIATVPVVVALADLPEGATIDRSMVTANPWPVPTIPAGAFSSPDSVVGRVTRVAVFRGEPLVPGRLAPVGTGPGLEVKITPGKRAMALRINDVAGISGFIQPNSRVDVMVTLASQSAGQKQQVAKLFMENMRVLSVGHEVQRDAQGKPINAATITLEVTPEEAERLAVATSQGSIQLVLRGYGDPDSIDTKGATSRDVLSQLRVAQPAPVRTVSRPVPRRRSTPEPTPPPPPVIVEVPPKRPDSLVVKIYRGAEVTQRKFDRNDSTPQRQRSSNP